MRWLVSLLVVWWLAVPAAAGTGASMGGGDWGGGGASDSSYSSGSSDYSYSYSSSSSSSSSDYSYSHSSSSSDYSYSGGGGGGDLGLGTWIVILVVGVGLPVGIPAGIVVLGHFHHRRKQRPRGDRQRADVTVLRIAVDGRARRFVQNQLAHIAQKADTRTTYGRHAMLAEVTLLLRRVRDAWVYGGAVNEPMRKMLDAKAVFDRHVLDARARFRTETIRNTDGVITTHAAPDITPRAHEGEGLVLISIIVASKTELVTVKHIGDGETLRKALESIIYRSASDLIAVEVVWQPSKDEDRMSSVELEAKYPPPALIPIGGTLVGKVFCQFCDGPFPAELLTCPHCGGPSEGHTTSRAA